MLAALLLSYNTLAAMVFAGTIRYRVPWDFVLAVLAGFAIVEGWNRLRAQRASKRLVELGRSVGAALLRELRQRTIATRRTHRGDARRVGDELDDRRCQRRRVVRRDEETRLAVVDDLGQPTDADRDHGPPALHRLERNHPEALAARGDDDDRGALHRRPGRRDPPEEAHAVAERTARDVCLELGAQRPVADDLELGSRRASAIAARSVS